MKYIVTAVFACHLILLGLVPIVAEASTLQGVIDTVLESPAGLAAGLVTCSGPDCNFCTFMVMVNGIIAWLVGISMVIATIGLAIAGYKMVYSQGSSSAVSEAKNIFYNIVMGIIIIMSAWFFVDTLMKLAVGEEFGPWNLIDGNNCGAMFVAPTELKDSVELIGWEVEGTMLEEDNMLSPELRAFIGTTRTGNYVPTNDTPPDGSFTYQSGISVQASHASSELNTLLNCIASKVPAGVGQISSISDSHIVSGSKTWQDCWEGECSHTSGSCHYGNGNGVIGKSYAVDFGDENNAQDLMGAASVCGAGYINNEGNHIHVSAAACLNN